MHKLTKFFQDAFGVNRSEARGITILLPIIFIIVFSEPLFRLVRPVEPFSKKEVQQLDSLVALWEEGDSIARVYFRFNPNTASVEQLESLGIHPRISTRIRLFREKGGEFSTRNDLLKIYGFDSALYTLLYAYIDLPEQMNHERLSVDRQKHVFPTRGSRTPFDLNEADTTTLEEIRGIGKVLARRIIKFREKLGGFIHLDQLYEVYGLDSVTVKTLAKACFIAPSFVPKKIDLNNVSENQFMHPYLSRNQARAIVAFRKQHGPYQAMADLRKVALIDSVTYHRILPYMSIQ